jgi:hypothetical protein
MTNLLEETVLELSAHGKSEEDVVCVGTTEVYFSWEEFKALADVNYNSGFGWAEVATNLIVFGDDWMMQREEYDGSEWWSFTSFDRPTRKVSPKALTVEQAQELGRDATGWSTLEKLNG